MSYSEAYNTTPHQFNIYHKAFKIRVKDELFLRAKAAWFNQTVQATKGKGKNTRSIYKNFDDFYNWEQEIENIFNPKEEKSQHSLADVNELMNEYLSKEVV
nr:MAG TPA: hypothetical protein [Caudoviricetes sp.]